MKKSIIAVALAVAVVATGCGGGNSKSSTISSVGLVTFENGVFMYGGTAYDKR